MNIFGKKSAEFVCILNKKAQKGAENTAPSGTGGVPAEWGAGTCAGLRG